MSFRSAPSVIIVPGGREGGIGCIGAGVAVVGGGSDSSDGTGIVGSGSGCDCCRSDIVMT